MVHVLDASVVLPGGCMWVHMQPVSVVDTGFYSGDFILADMSEVCAKILRATPTLIKRYPFEVSSSKKTMRKSDLNVC